LIAAEKVELSGVRRGLETVDDQNLKLAGLLQVIRVRFLWSWKSVSGSDLKQTLYFDVETLGWRSVAYNRVFARFAAQKFPMAH